LLHGAISAPTKTTFMPAVAQTTRDGNLPPPPRRRACCCLGAARALARMLSGVSPAAADARGAALRP